MGTGQAARWSKLLDWRLVGRVDGTKAKQKQEQQRQMQEAAPLSTGWI